MQIFAVQIMLPLLHFGALENKQQAGLRWLLLSCILSVIAAHGQALGADVNILTTLERLTSHPLANRELSLADLGLELPESLAASDARRELFFPVPLGLPLANATLHFDADYLRGDGGRTTLLLSLDAYPISARAFTADQGEASLRVGIDGQPRNNGFVKLSVAWASIVANSLCEDNRSIGNVLTIHPTTRLTYSFDTREIKNLATAWSALPPAPQILVSSSPLSPEAYDTAWRLGLALSRAGKRPAIRALPAIHEEVDLQGLEVPTAVRDIPAFAALAGGGRHRLATPAELGALLTLGPDSLLPDLIVADGKLLETMKGAMDALAQEILTTGLANVGEIGGWLDRNFPLANGTLDGGEIRLARQGGRTLIAVAAGSGGKAAELFGDYWRRALETRAVIPQAIAPPLRDANQVTLGALGAVPGTLNVLARGDWTANFDLSNLAVDGRMPKEVAIDLVAAPGPTRSQPVISLYLNDYLLSAMRLAAEGKTEHLAATIPLYALAPRNLLRVTFQRQPVSDDCREEPQAFPVAVLPTSHFRFGNASFDENFTGMFPRLAREAELLLPASYLQDALRTLPLVIRLAEATGLTPLRSTLRIAEEGDAFLKPGKAFLALDVIPSEARPKAWVEDNRLLIGKAPGAAPYFDLVGLERIGVAQVLQAGATTGVLWQTLGPDLPTFDRPFFLSQGDIALVGGSGPLVQIDGSDPSNQRLDANEGGIPSAPDLLFPGFSSWVTPVIIVIVVFFLILVIVAGIVKRRRMSAKS